ncbi:hypothetical protein [Stenotrophomonas sp.]|uniref:hypothetical protein n=1 Tax=Stenotrophomonas sp. TaxID=69392 RepID=UPI0028A06F16|nr:hypothetical protein [Stenotrophomonas sp.]
MIRLHLDSLVANDDAVRHDLFSAARQFQRIYTLPLMNLFQLIDSLERRPGALEDLSVGQLISMIAAAEVAP